MPFTTSDNPLTCNQEYGFHVLKSTRQQRISEKTYSKPRRNSELSKWTDEYSRKMKCNPFSNDMGSIVSKNKGRKSSVVALNPVFAPGRMGKQVTMKNF